MVHTEVLLLNKELIDLMMYCFHRYFTTIICNKIYEESHGWPASQLRAEGFLNHPYLSTSGLILALHEIYYARTFLALEPLSQLKDPEVAAATAD